MDLLGHPPITIGELNRYATHDRPKPPPATPPVDPLDGIEITEEYRDAVNLIESAVPIVFVSGKAGTGKSTIIHFLRHTLKKNIVVVAPTGVAALNVRGATIHSYFRLPPRIVTDEDIKEVKDRRLYSKLDLLIVDEISMVRADVIDAMDKFLRINGKYKDRPFGGTQLLLVGDLFQLPPVVTRVEESVLFSRKYSSAFFFSAKSLENCRLVLVELKKNFRQRDPTFTEMLNKIRVAEHLEEVIPAINIACATDNRENHLITLTCTNAAADHVNAFKLSKLPGEARIFVGEVSGKFAIEDERLPSPINLALKPGAQVMFTKNDEMKRWVNGTIGRVTVLTEASIQIELVTDQPGSIHEVHRVKWESFKYTYDYTDDSIKPVATGQYTQYPLMLAWAVTIHKSQGKTLEKVRIDFGNGAFASGQVYVALSRCRTLSDISLARPVNPREVKCDQRIKRFYDAMAGLQRT
jgi:ATP-dependent DNA helicase PIF1